MKKQMGNGNQGNLFMAMYNVGDRIEAATHTDSWMAGDRYGEVTGIGHVYVHVKMDVSGKIKRFAPENILGKVK